MFLCDANVCPSVRPSISLVLELERVMQQVEYNCFADLRTGYIDPLFKELCLIICEVVVLNPDELVKVNGTQTPGHLVQEVYSRLRNEHIRLVFANYHGLTCRVYNKRAYLRTALYNAVFEIESHFINNGFYD
jgi:hypothetical protein